jgi:uncharacterized membrane protein
MWRIAAAYLATALVFGALDAVWLTQSFAAVYLPEIGRLTLPSPEPVAALAFYLVYIAGVVRFAVAPALVAGGPARAAVQGAWLGLIAYATYDLTNLATLQHWTLKVSLIDMTWGCVATATAACAGTAIVGRFARAPKGT